MPEMNKTHRNQYALITGATSGIGYELAKLFAKDGYHLILVARSQERLQEVTDELKQFGVEVTPVDKDLFHPDAAAEIYQHIKQMGIQIHALVNNAGQGEHGKFTDIDVKRHLNLIQLNITSLVELTYYFLSDMIQLGEGKILNLASVVSKTPAPEFTIYAATKAFVLSFTEALAVELEGSNITVTALLPGRTDTDFFHKAHMLDTKEYQDHSLANPEDVARDGYDALMRGDNRIISGGMNKMMVGMMNTMPDSANATNMRDNMQPSGKQEKEKKQKSEHPSSQKERSNIGKTSGDQNTK